MARYAEQTQRDCYNVRISPPENFVTWGKEADRKWEEGDDIGVLEFKTTEYGRSKRVVCE